MITVSISINGEPIFARSAVNRLEEVNAYIMDDGKYIDHDPNDGAVALGIKMLMEIKENPDKLIAAKRKRQTALRKKYAQLAGQTDIEQALREKNDNKA